jgi:predicted phosphoadenosine phosphosulfate sulfurtransferase
VKKQYLSTNVYDAANERIDYIFKNFENIYVSFSGGKDSGVVLNLVLDYMRRHNIKKKIGVLFIDLEAFYKGTIDFIEKMIFDNLDLIEPYWVCLPMLTTNAVSMYELYWIFWEESKRDRWVRPMPAHPFIINTGNNPFDFYKPNMTFEEFIAQFGDWYARAHGSAYTACLVGIRTDESLNRFRAIARDDKGNYDGKIYSTVVSDNAVNFYPIYDWHVNDIWTYNGKYHKPYNHIYDLFYKAGVPLHKMRICEPYGDEQKAGLNMFKVIEPDTWFKVVDRVSGANFGNIYAGSKATGAKRIELPAGHTWKSYCKFLLKTLPKETRDIYVTKFVRFIRYWSQVGCPIADEDILTLEKLAPDAFINIHTYSNRGKGGKEVIKAKAIPDVLPGLDNKADFLSWRRLCMTILKNDITCQSLSFSITKRQVLKQNELLKKYRNEL